MLRVRSAMVWLAIAALLFVAPMALAQDVTPLVEVEDQAIVDGAVTIDRVVSDGPGWIVIHADNNGAPGDVLGWTAVMDGENTDVVVDIDMDMVDTDTMTETTFHAMLHSDLGIEGTYEFPGADVPVQLDGETVMTAFVATFEDEAAVQPTATVEATAQPTATVEATAQVTATAVTDVDDDEPETLPETGGSTTPWLPLTLLALGVAVIIGSALIMRGQSQSM
jgi:hypothetical protein